jgi:hypothetical protein
LLLLFPLWWALGVAAFIYIVLAVPMAWQLRRRGRIRVPPFFAVWLLFLVWVIASGVMLGHSPPNAMAESGGLIGYGVRVADFLAATVILLYVGNLTETEMSQARVIRLLGYFFFFFSVAGGVLGTLAQHFAFTSPLEMVLPHSLRSNNYVQVLVHPAAAQIQDVLGYDAPRPKAPFEYTNSWGNCMSLLLVWFVVWGWGAAETRRRRAYGAVLLCVAAVPIVYSLNRALWIGIGLSLVYGALHLGAKAKLALCIVVVVALVGAPIMAMTPLSQVVQGRLDNPRSNEVRAYLDHQSVVAARYSPIVGWGSTRATIGSSQSIAIGKTHDCPACGNKPLGSTGLVWLLLVSTGFVGTGLYIGFILLSLWRYRKNRSPTGIAGRLVLWLGLFYMFFYNAMPSALSITFISLALLWRAEVATQEPDPEEEAVGYV